MFMCDVNAWVREFSRHKCQQALLPQATGRQMTGQQCVTALEGTHLEQH